MAQLRHVASEHRRNVKQSKIDSSTVSVELSRSRLKARSSEALSSEGLSRRATVVSNYGHGEAQAGPAAATAVMTRRSRQLSRFSTAIVTIRNSRAQPRRAQTQSGTAAVGESAASAKRRLASGVQCDHDKATILGTSRAKLPPSTLATTRDTGKQGDRRTVRSQARRRKTGRSHDTARSGKAFSSTALGKGRSCARVAAMHSRGRTRRSPRKAHYSRATGGPLEYGQGAVEQGTVEPGNRRPTRRQLAVEQDRTAAPRSRTVRLHDNAQSATAPSATWPARPSRPLKSHE